MYAYFIKITANLFLLEFSLTAYMTFINSLRMKTKRPPTKNRASTTCPPPSFCSEVLSRLKLGAVVFALLATGVSHAQLLDSPDGLSWSAQTSGGTGIIRIAGTSLENTIMSFSDSAELRKFNSATQSWETLTSWTAHYNTSGGWAGNTPMIAVSGSTIYVGGSDNQLGYSTDGGNTWTNIAISHPFSGFRDVQGIYAYGNQAYVLRVNGYTNLVENGAETALSNNRPMGNVTFQSVGGSGIAGIGENIWIANASQASGGDSPNSVRESATMGEGSSAWTSAVTATGGGNFGGIFALDENTLYKAGGNGSIGFSSNGGTSFSTINLGFAGTTRAVFAESTDSIWVASNGGFYYFDGDIWQDVSDQLVGFSGQDLRGVYGVDGYLWVGASDGSLWMGVIPEPSTGALIAGALFITAFGTRKQRQTRN